MKRIYFVMIFVSSFLAMSAQTTTPAQTENKEEKHVVMMNKDIFLKDVYDYVKNPNQWVYEGELPALIDFYADWCGPCRMISPILEELAKEYKGKIVIYKVDTQKEQELSYVFQVRSLPTLLFIPKDGQPQMAVGARNKEQFKEMIDAILLAPKAEPAAQAQ